jgi:hypothetical protein
METAKSIKNILDKAEVFKARGFESLADGKRHDLIKRDEKKTMCDAHIDLGWSFAKIGIHFDRDPRTVKKSVQKEQNEFLKRKEHQQKKEQHYAELSITALKLADILSWYTKQQRFFIDPLISSDFPYTTHQLDIASLNKGELTNLKAHLQGEIPELIPISEYPKACEQWFALGDKKWEKETPSVTITKDLILKLQLRGNQGNFSGKCHDCL